MAAVTIPSFPMIGLHNHFAPEITTPELHTHTTAQSAQHVTRSRRVRHPTAWYIIEELFGADCLVCQAGAIGLKNKAAIRWLITEVGRIIIVEADSSVRRVLYTKQSTEKRFLSQDAARYDLIRRALDRSFLFIDTHPRAAEVPVDASQGSLFTAATLTRTSSALIGNQSPREGWPRRPATASCWERAGRAAFQGPELIGRHSCA